MWGQILPMHCFEKGDDVVLFDVLADSSRIADIVSDVQIIRGNLGNWAEVMQAVHSSRPENIFHLGAMITMPARGQSVGSI